MADTPVAERSAGPRIAAVTMVYNEATLLPIWLRHYARQVGAAHCYVVDHGSDDGSTDALAPVSVVRIPRSPMDDERRAGFLSQFCGSLLAWYDGVVHTDVDEIVLPDPALSADIPTFVAACATPVVTAIGLNVMQMADEPALDPLRSPLAQRRYVAFSSALCKPVLIRRPVVWVPGFHCADAPLSFDGLFLFHLRWCDRVAALARLAKTRAMPWAGLSAGAHQRVTDQALLDLLGDFERRPRRDDVALARDAPAVVAWLQAVVDSQAGREAATYRIDLDLNAAELWPIPERFKQA